MKKATEYAKLWNWISIHNHEKWTCQIMQWAIYTKQERKKNVKIEYKKDVLSRDQHWRVYNVGTSVIYWCTVNSLGFCDKLLIIHSHKHFSATYKTLEESGRMVSSRFPSKWNIAIKKN